MALPVVPAPGCGSAGVPFCQAAGVGSSLAGGLVDTVFSALAAWVVSGATWLLDQVGAVISATTPVDVSSGWFGAHYAVIAALAGAVMLPMLLAGIIQSVYRQDFTQLLRSALVHLPLAVLLTAVMVQLVQLALAATDALSSTVASGSDLSGALTQLVSDLSTVSTDAGVPAFVVMLGALLVALGAFVLWLELLVRASAIYVAVLFLPLALASLVWPAISHWCRRLVDTLVALILSKFVIVAILSLAVGEIASGSGFASVLGGGALLVLATFTPFTLLRLVPMVEAGAVHQLEGARQRAQQAVVGPPRAAVSAATFALAHTGGPAVAAGAAGTGPAGALESPGDPASLIPSWREVSPPPVAEVGRVPEPGRGSGAEPLWGWQPGTGTDDDRPAGPSGRHEIGRDDLGPVIRWVPGSGDPVGAPGDRGPAR
jgi:hypothetical protein